MVTQEQVDSANQKDLAEFLISRGVQLKKQSGQYLWEEQNVWIHGSEWYSHYEQTGGRAVRFVMKYFGKSFFEAVNELNGDADSLRAVSNKQCEATSVRLPESNKNTFRINMYLRNSRCISQEVIDSFVKMGMLYEDAEHHCCVFVGRDDRGKPGHCHKRSTLSKFRQTLEGSKAEYAFHYIGYDDTIYAFEAPIDMLAYISMHPGHWRRHSYVALCSVSDKALMHRLEVNSGLKKVVLCLDNDEPGQAAVQRIRDALVQKGYSDVRVEVPVNKDWDEDLQVICGVRDGINPKEVSQWTESEHSSLSLL